jgi:hypothetical protein
VEVEAVVTRLRVLKVVEVVEAPSLWFVVDEVVDKIDHFLFVFIVSSS